MANEFEDALKDLVSEQFKDGEPLGLRDETTGEFVKGALVEETADEGVNENEVYEEIRRVPDEDENPAREDDNEEADEEGEAPESDEDEDEDEDESLPGEEKPASKKPRAERRIDHLTSIVKRLERELRAEREGREAAERAPKRADGTAYATADEYARDQLTRDDKAPKKPKAEDKVDGKRKYALGEFDEAFREDYDDYLEARRDFLAAKRGEFEKGALNSATDAAAASQQEFQTRINAHIEAGKKAYKDFDEKVVKGIEKDTWPLSEAGARFLADSEVGADLAYHLATNVKVAKEIADLSPVAQIRRFTKLEDTLVAKAAERAKRKTRGSSAPVPIREKARGGGRVETNRFDSEDFASVEKNWNQFNSKRK